MSELTIAIPTTVLGLICAFIVNYIYLKHILPCASTRRKRRAYLMTVFGMAPLLAIQFVTDNFQGSNLKNRKTSQVFLAAFLVCIVAFSILIYLAFSARV